ncbi:MAG: tetratricopeptide repeat protein [Candidatus Levybacteria bacterium]|nr:tetratricopeptide repeat protein [Candidatus Levybacteria bacterium]
MTIKILNIIRLVSFYRVLKYLAFLAIFIFSLKGLYGEDIWFHLATGRYIFDNYTIPVKDVFSFTANGALWINQGWLADLVFYLFYKISGYTGLIVFFAMLSTGVFVLLYKVLKLLNEPDSLNDNFILFLTFLASFFAIARFQARPEVGSYLFLLLIIYILLRFKNSWKILFLLPVTFLIFVNWQAGFAPFGIFVLGGFVVKEVIGVVIAIRQLAEKQSSSSIEIAMSPSTSFRILEMTKLKFIIPASLLSLLSIFLNPNGLKGVFYFIGVQPSFLTSDFTEWGSLIKVFQEKGGLFANKDNTVLVSGYFVMFVVLLIYLFFYFKNRGKINDLPINIIFWLGLSSPFILLPIYANRFASLAVIFIVIVIVALGKIEIFKERNTKNKFRASFFDNFLNNFAKRRVLWQSIGLISLSIILFLIRISIYPPSVSSFQKANPYRDDFFKFLKNSKISGNMYNTLEDGGYFEWTDPSLKVFMDGRLDVFTTTGVYEDYKKIYDFPPKKDWEKILNKYNIEYLVLPGWQKEPMAIIRKSKHYDLVYWSDYLFVLVKNSGRNKDFVQKSAFKTIEPFKEDDYKKEDIEKAKSEYERLSRLSPNSSSVYVSLASVYQQLGSNDLAIANYEKALKIKQDDAMTRLALGSLYFAKKECQKAQDQFDQASESKGVMIQALSYRNLGFVYLNCFQNPAMAYYNFKKFVSMAKNLPLNPQIINEANQVIFELERMRRKIR